MEKLIYRLNYLFSRIGILVMMFLTFITVIDISGRYLFNKPLPGTIELTELALVVIVYLTLGYTEHFGEHIVIDTVYKAMPKGVRYVLFIIASIISFASILLMSWQLYVYAGRMLSGGYKTGVLGIPYYPVVIIASIGSLSFGLAIISNMVKFIKKGEEGK